jgi:hypothetical protein
LCSDASGRYQFLSTTWDGLKTKIGAVDFSPAAQDLAAVELIRQRGALEDVEAGRLEAAIAKLNQTWASFPGSPHGQPTKPLARLREFYNQRLTTYGNNPNPTPEQQQATSPAPLAQAESAPDSGTKGTPIVVAFGWDRASMVGFQYWHVGTKAQGRGLDTLTLEGVSARWLLSRRRKNTAYQQLTLRRLAQQIATMHGLRLEMVGDGPTLTYVDQTGISDYELLLREATAAGYTVRDEAAKLIVTPAIPNFSGYVIRANYCEDLSFSDSAQTALEARGASPVSSSTPAVNAEEAKITINPLTGQVEQNVNENRTATGRGQFAVSGSPTPPVRGTAAVATRGQEPSPVAIGIPGREPSPITVSEQTATTATLRQEQRRIQQYESRATVMTTPPALELKPGDIIGLSSTLVPETLAREWMVGEVSHSLRNGGLRTSLTFFSPDSPIVQDNVATTTPSSPVAGNCAQRIAAAAAAYQGQSTAAGPDGGRNACVWAVNNILRNAGVNIPWSGNYVPTVKQVLDSQATRINAPEPGAIVIYQDNGSPPYPHIGIVMSDGKTHISNSSSRARFSWVASEAAYTAYYGRPPLYYRLRC